MTTTPPAGGTAPLFDTHAHLDIPPLRGDDDAVVARAAAAGVTRLVTVGIDAESSRRAVGLAAKHPGVWAAVGLHPHDSARLSDALLDELEELARRDKVVAVGETGLDFFRDRAPRPAQDRAFREHVRLARRLGLPLVVHDRDAHGEVLAVLKEEKAHEAGGILHCFSGDLAFAREVAKLGFLVSIPGTVTYPKAERLVEAVRGLPLKHLLLETDCPYLAPVPHRGKPNEPAHVPLVAEAVARIKGLSPDDVARETTWNALRLFRLPEEGGEGRLAYVIRNSLYLNVTNRCTNGCVFCAKRGDFHVKGHPLKLDREPSAAELVEAAGDVGGYDEVVFCGFGEPLLRPDVVAEAGRALRAKGARSIRVNTDGLANLVHGRNVLAELEGVVDSLSVSLNAPDAATYARICPNRYGAASFAALLDFLRQAPAFVPSVTATAVALPGLDTEAVSRLAASIPGVSFRLRPHDDVG